MHWMQASTAMRQHIGLLLNRGMSNVLACRCPDCIMQGARQLASALAELLDTDSVSDGYMAMLCVELVERLHAQLVSWADPSAGMRAVLLDSALAPRSFCSGVSLEESP